MWPSFTRRMMQRKTMNNEEHNENANHCHCNNDGNNDENDEMHYIFLFDKYNTYRVKSNIINKCSNKMNMNMNATDSATAAASPATPATAASIASSSQAAQQQQMQLMSQMTQMINNANLSCAKGTDCYKNQQITDARNNYNAAVITQKNAPQTVDTALKNYLVASKGQNGANQELMSRYKANGEADKSKLTQQFDDWSNDMTSKIATLSQHTETVAALTASNRLTTQRLDELANETDDATNKMNLLERNIHFTGQVIKTINGIEYYVKLVYWLAFLTWIACVIYDRTFTMKTAGLFVVFTVIALLQDQIMGMAAAAF